MDLVFSVSVVDRFLLWLIDKIGYNATFTLKVLLMTTASFAAGILFAAFLFAYSLKDMRRHVDENASSISLTQIRKNDKRLTYITYPKSVSNAMNSLTYTGKIGLAFYLVIIRFLPIKQMHLVDNSKLRIYFWIIISTLILLILISILLGTHHLIPLLIKDGRLIPVE